MNSESIASQSAISEIRTVTLGNGLRVLVQTMPWQRTAAFSLCLSAGVQMEAERFGGLSGLVCEMVQRGAGNHSSRDLVSLQDNLGIERSAGVSTATVSFGGAMPAESLSRAIALYAEIVRSPHLPGDQLDDARMMSLQELRALEDEPTHRVMRRLREIHYGDRLGRSTQGTEAGLKAITHKEVRDFYTDHYHGGDGILAVAGNVDPDAVLEWVSQAFEGWKTGTTQPLGPAEGRTAYEHLDSPSSQTHIGLAFESIPYGHPDYFRMRAGIGILSDGMSSRLFDRVREQRGLCYTVTASCHSLKHAGGVFCYAGTTPERAQETLDVTLHEIEHMIDDLDPGELERWKVRIQSSLIMEQESSASRASSLASDQYQLGRTMSTEELESIIESLTLEEVQEYWVKHPPRDYRIVTLGPQPLVTPVS